MLFPKKTTWAQQMTFAGDVMQLGSEIQQARIAVATERMRAKMFRYNAAVDRGNAAAAMQKAKFDSVRHAQYAREEIGVMRTRIAAAGAGEAFLVEAEQRAEHELMNQLIGYEGRAAAGRFLSNAQLSDIRAKLARDRAKYARTTGAVKVGMGLLTTFATMDEQGWFET